MNNSPEKEQNRNIVKFVGRPVDTKDEKELSNWKKFLKFIWPWAKEGGRLISRSKQLTEDFYQAEVSKKQNEATKFAAEAANIAAETDLKVQQKVKIVNEEISRIFSDPNIPEIAKQLQLANLMTKNPDLVDQLNKIEQIVSKLKAVNFTKFQMKIESDQSIGLEAKDTADKEP